MALSHLIGKLIGGNPAAQLIVEGVITESGTHQPRTRLGPNPAAEEAYFALTISSAALSNGKVQKPQSIVPAEFSGERELLEQFSVDDRVRITCTTATGRQIAAIEHLAS
ncbi:MAG: hypothetical protein KC502_14660 [Myxococcales bacterium]|nr:hypothetical protein [Myxococcales bacterium]